MKDQIKICGIHGTEMILGGHPNKYYFCPKCRDEGELASSEKHNKAISVLNEKIGEDGVDALLEILNGDK